MTQPHPSWKVRPHGELSEIDDGMLSVVGPIRMPIGSFPRRMTVIRLSDSRLVVWSAMALGGTEMAKLEAFGRPAFLIVPNDHHRFDAKALRAQMLQWADMQSLKRILVSHGEPIDANPQQTLRSLAGSLA